jgi:nucleotide-binding universal stress UspA family protein
MPLDSLKGPVLVATDLESAADEALRQADSLVPHDLEPLQVCHVLPKVLRIRMLFPHLHEKDSGEFLELERQAGRRVAERVESVTGRSAGQYAVAVDSGSPHGGILRQAERLAAGLIVIGAGAAARVVPGASCPVLVARLVVGTRGRTGLARLALGSVAEAVLAAADCSVLVVRFQC